MENPPPNTYHPCENNMTIDSVIAANEELVVAIEAMRASLPIKFGCVSVALEEAVQDDIQEKKTTLWEKFLAVLKRIGEFFANFFSKGKTKEDAAKAAQDLKQKEKDLEEAMSKAFDEAFGDMADADNSQDIGELMILKALKSKEFSDSIREAILQTKQLHPYIFGSSNGGWYGDAIMAVESDARKLAQDLKSAISNPDTYVVEKLTALLAGAEELADSHVLKSFEGNKDYSTVVNTINPLIAVKAIGRLVMNRPNVMFGSACSQLLAELTATAKQLPNKNLDAEKAAQVASLFTKIHSIIAKVLAKIQNAVDGEPGVHGKYLTAFNATITKSGYVEKLTSEIAEKYPHIKGLRATALMSMGLAHMRAMNQ